LAAGEIMLALKLRSKAAMVSILRRQLRKAEVESGVNE